MQRYIKRLITAKIKQKLKNMPGVVILGPRQCGKSTLAKAVIAEIGNAVYLDLERPSDVNKLRDPEAFFGLNTDKLICLDEIQRAPEMFPVLRSVIDENSRNGQFIILGPASPDLIRQSSETLAGRVSYFELTPFLLKEVSEDHRLNTLRRLWLRGGFPRSYLAPDERERERVTSGVSTLSGHFLNGTFRSLILELLPKPLNASGECVLTCMGNF